MKSETRRRYNKLLLVAAVLLFHIRFRAQNTCRNQINNNILVLTHTAAAFDSVYVVCVVHEVCGVWENCSYARKILIMKWNQIRLCKYYCCWSGQHTGQPTAYMLTHIKVCHNSEFDIDASSPIQYMGNTITYSVSKKN